MTHSPRWDSKLPGATARGFADRFFQRQRREILGRIGTLAARRRARRYGITLAAAAVMLAALAAGLVTSDPTGSSLSADEPVFALEFDVVPANDISTDPLHVYGVWQPQEQMLEASEHDPLPPIDLDDLEPASAPDGDWFAVGTSQSG